MAKNGEEKDSPPEKKPEAEKLPTKFVLKLGGHRFITLIGEVSQMVDGKRVIRPGVRAEFKPVIAGSKLFVFDVERSSAVTRS